MGSRFLDHIALPFEFGVMFKGLVVGDKFFQSFIGMASFQLL